MVYRNDNVTCFYFVVLTDCHGAVYFIKEGSRLHQLIFVTSVEDTISDNLQKWNQLYTMITHQSSRVKRIATTD